MKVSLGQDAHYSQFYRDPLYTNPAQTGAFEGSYRFTGHHRNQWRSIGRPFETYGLSADAANAFRLSGVGLGLNIFNDVAGDGNLSDLMIQLAASYTIKLTKDSTQLLTFGAQGGYYRKQIDFNELTFDDQYRNDRFQPGISTAESIAKSSLNSGSLHIGALYIKKWNNKTKLNLGFALNNLTRPNQSFTNEEIPLSVRYSIHADADIPLKDKWAALPGILVMSQGPHREFLFGSNFRYAFDSRSYNYRAFQFGAWYRLQDALAAFIGLDWGRWQFGASYDINVSSLDRATGNRGGFELSVIYILPSVLPKRKLYKNCIDYL
jgi:type IX secretion system PorP/SprF family membrane protein